MAKSAFEKQIEKQMRQQKQLEDRKRRDEQKRARDDARIAQEEAIRQRAATIISGSECVSGMRIMDKTAEDVLECLLRISSISPAFLLPPLVESVVPTTSNTEPFLKVNFT